MVCKFETISNYPECQNKRAVYIIDWYNLISPRVRLHSLSHITAHTLGPISSRQISTATDNSPKTPQRLRLGWGPLIYITERNPTLRLSAPLTAQPSVPSASACSKWLLLKNFTTALDLHHKAHPQSPKTSSAFRPTLAVSGGYRPALLWKPLRKWWSTEKWAVSSLMGT